MALSDQDIIKMMKIGKIKITPFSKDQLGAASVDLTLSNNWGIFKENYLGKTVDLNKTSFKKIIKNIKSDTMILNPGEMCLGKTREKISLSSDILATLEGRTRYARLGLTVHVTASLVQPGSSNHQVLEIVNLSPLRIILHEGMRISQISFHKLDTPTTKPYRKYGKAARVQ
jgi:dCTP deaminase